MMTRLLLIVIIVLMKSTTLSGNEVGANLLGGLRRKYEIQSNAKQKEYKEFTSKIDELSKRGFNLHIL